MYAIPLWDHYFNKSIELFYLGLYNSFCDLIWKETETLLNVTLFFSG